MNRLIEALTESRGSMTLAAKNLGMSRNGLYAAVKRHNVNPNCFRPEGKATARFVLRPDLDLDDVPEVDAELVDEEIERALASLDGGAQ